MDLPVLKLMLVGLGFFSSFLAPFVESQGDVIPGQESEVRGIEFPGEKSSSPPAQSPPPSPSPPPALRPSQPPRSSGSPAPKPALAPASSPANQELNLEKKIALMFAGIAVILQVCVVALLVIKRRQLLKNHVRY